MNIELGYLILQVIKYRENILLSKNTLVIHIKHKNTTRFENGHPLKVQDADGKRTEKHFNYEFT